MKNLEKLDIFTNISAHDYILLFIEIREMFPTNQRFGQGSFLCYYLTPKERLVFPQP